MAVEGSGKVVDPIHKGLNGHAVVPKSRKVKPRRSLVWRALSIVTRLLTWYSIITVLFSCPPSVHLLTETSPKICKPYFQVRSIIAPYVTPYYDTYAASYVNSARPYYQVLDKKLLTPATVYGKKYGAPRVAQAQAFGQAQWEKSVQPQVSRLSLATQQQYSNTLGPHVNKVIATVSPYYAIAKDSALQTYHTSILPTYNTLQPHAKYAYGLGSDFVITTGIPYTKWAWATGVVFLDRTVWPKIRVLYGENVEPQLVRIGERLGRYRDGKKLQAAVDKIDISSSAVSISSTYSSISSSVASAHATDTVLSTVREAVSEVSSSAVAAKTPLSEEEQRSIAQQVVAEDLKTWQEKFAKAADQGSDALDQRITEITDRLIQSQAQGVGEAHIIQLEETVKSGLTELKKTIISIVQDSSSIENSEIELTAAVRKAGLAIKGKAQAVRSWRQNYDRETNSLVSKAADETFEIIDHIRDLGLQEIGMRWAWTDGITHKDWTKYHSLKTTFDEWRKDVEEVATAHLGLSKARAASEDVESRAMAIAEDAVYELSRLKETGRWKISAADSSDDFSTKYMPAAAAAAGQKIASKISEASEAVIGSSTGTVESLGSVASSLIVEATDSASSLASIASSSVIGTSTGTIESLSSVISSLAEKASDSIMGTSTGTTESLSSTASSAMANAVNSMSSAVENASSSAIGSSDATVESFSLRSESTASSAEEILSPIFDNVSDFMGQASSSLASVASSMSAAPSLETAAESILSTASVKSSSTSNAASSVSERASSASGSLSSAVSSASTAVSDKVWGGAMAQSVEARKIIYEDVLDEDSSNTEKIWSMASEAGDRFNEMTRAVSEALLAPSKTEQGSVGSMTSLASDQYSKALSAASLALYDAPQETGLSIAGVASSRYAKAVAAASAVIYGTPIPAVNSVASQASSAYSAATSRALDQYSRALSAVSAQMSSDPTPVHQELISSVASAYSDSLASASSGFDDALSSASIVIYGTGLSPQQSLVSVASARYSEAQGYASSQYSAVKTAINGSPTPAHKSLLAAADKSYSDLLSGADRQYSSAVDAASSFVYGPPPAAMASISAIAASRLSEGLSVASAQYSSARIALGATPAPTGYLSQAQNQYYAGIGLAHARYSEFIEAASLAILPTPTSFHESLYNKASIGILGTAVGPIESAISVAQSHYSRAVTAASANLEDIMSSVHDLGEKASPTENLIDLASSKYSAAVQAASEALASASSAASSAAYGIPTGKLESVGSAVLDNAESAASLVSTAVYGSEAPWTESVASAASENWESLITKASIQIYGAPTPIYQSAYSQAGEFAAQATAGAAAQYLVIHSLISELVSGKEPDFTESVYSRLSSAYYTGAGAAVSSASSYASEAWESASSVVSSVFTPPPALEAILEDASSRIDEGVKAASVHIYGTSKGTYEQVTSSAAAAYSSLSSVASVNAYGSSTGYVEAASSSLAEAAASAHAAIIEVIYGSSIPAYAFATSVIADNLSQATSIVRDGSIAAQAKVSGLVYGPEHGAVESAQARLSTVVESARLKLVEFASAAGEGASSAIDAASSQVEEFASSISSTVANPSKKDEL